jgi:hypothetical protein
LDRKWTNIIIWSRDRASISVQQLRIIKVNATRFLLYCVQLFYGVVQTEKNPILRQNNVILFKIGKRLELGQKTTYFCDFSATVEPVQPLHSLRLWTPTILNSRKILNFSVFTSLTKCRQKNGENAKTKTITRRAPRKKSNLTTLY